MTYVPSDAPEEMKAFYRAVDQGDPLEIDESVYAEYRDGMYDAVDSYPYPIVMMDGTQRLCDFVNVVGTGPYLGFWREDGRYFCQQIVDRLEPTADGMDNYLPPPPSYSQGDAANEHRQPT